MEEEARRARALMRAIDTCYFRGAHHRVLGLEALDEDEELEVDDGAPDDEVGVEEQFVAAWYAFSSSGPSFAGDASATEGYLLDVLRSACLRGMAPRGLKLHALPQLLLPVAAALARDRQALIARYRAHSKRFGR